MCRTARGRDGYICVSHSRHGVDASRICVRRDSGDGSDGYEVDGVGMTD